MLVSLPCPPRRWLTAPLSCALLTALAAPAAAHEATLPLAPGGRAMVGPYLVETWNHRAGLPQNTVTDIAQRPDGFLWLTTFAGLARFDGQTFRRFGGDTTGGGVDLRFTVADFAPDGALWLGLEHGGVVRFVDGRFDRPPQPAALATARVWAIDAGESGVLVGSTAGLARFDGAGWHVIPGPDADTGSVSAVAWAPTGGAWIGARGTVQWMTPDGARRVVGAVEGDQPVLALLPEGDGAWVAGGSRVGWASADGVRWLTDVPGYQVWDLAADPAGGLWAVGQGRVVHHPDRAALRAALQVGASSPASDAWGLGGRGARSVTVDDDGTVWVGTDGAGLVRLWRQPFDRLGTADGLADAEVRLVAGDGAGGAWVVTGCRNLHHVIGDDVRRVAHDLPNDD